MQLLVASVHLRDLSDATQRWVADESLLVGDGSAAALERDDNQYDGAWGKGSQMVCLEVVPRLIVVADHVRGLAALTAAPGVSLALASLVRPTLESLATLSWLYDSEIDGRERVRRRFNLRLVSLAHEENLASMVRRPSGGFRATIDDIAAEAGRHSFRFVPPKTSKRGIVHPGYLDTPPPSAETLITRLTAPASDTVDIGGLLYRRTSAVAHGNMHGLQPFLLARGTPPIPGTLRAEFGLPFAWFCIMTASVVTALNATMWPLLGHYGWDPVEWADVSQSATDQWRAWLAPLAMHDRAQDD